MSEYFVKICLILLICVNGKQCVSSKSVYTTPGSHLQIIVIEIEESVHCDFLSDGTQIRQRIVNASTQHDTKKYQIVTSKRPTVTIQAPHETGSFPKGIHIIKLGRKKLPITAWRSKTGQNNYTLLPSDNQTYRTEGSPINLTFTLNTTKPLSDYSLRSNEGVVHYFFEFQLMIRHISSNDNGFYECVVVTPWIELVVATIRFLNQTDDNKIYGSEGQSMNISCATVSGDNKDKLSIIQNGTVLSESEIHIVTYTLIPSRHDNFKQYKCMGQQGLPFVRVTLLVKYAPDVKVVQRKDSLDCFATGFPQTYTFNKWEHQSEDGEHIRFLNGLQNGTLHQKMLRLKYQISGIYICTVSNGIPDMNGSLLQMGIASVHYTGEPIFVPENQNVKHGELGQSLTLTFILYSNPIMKEIWIDNASTGNNHAITQDVFNTPKRTFPYTVFGNKGNITGYEIRFETNILRSNDFHEYYLWSKNEFGFDFYRFEIINMGSTKIKATGRTRFITISCIAAGLFIYIITAHICLSIKQRMLHGMQRTTSEVLHYHTYDEIGSISNQAATVRFVVGEQEGQSQQTIVNQSSQITLNQNDNQMIFNNRPDTSLGLYPQGYPENIAHHNNILEETIDLPSQSSVEEIIYRSRSSIEEGYSSSDNSVRSFQRKHNQEERSSITNGTSSCSTDSEESKTDSLNRTSVDINVGDGYENPYQIIMPEIQDTHQYSSIIQPVENMDATDYVNLRLKF